MPRLTLQTLHNLYQLVSVRKEGPLTVSVKSFLHPSHSWLFSSQHLATYRVQIASFLSQLPADFLQSAGGVGLPWFFSIRLRNGVQWGDMDDADKLLAIARAASMVKSHTPLSVCDTPFCIILDDEIRASERFLPVEKQNKSLLYWKFHINL